MKIRAIVNKDKYDFKSGEKVYIIGYSAYSQGDHFNDVLLVVKENGNLGTLNITDVKVDMGMFY